MGFFHAPLYDARMNTTTSVRHRNSWLALALLVMSFAAAAPADLTLDCPRDYQVFQRVTRTRGAISVRGSADEGVDAIVVTLAGRGIDGEANQQFRAPVDQTTHTFNAAFEAPAGGWFRVTVQPMRGKETVAAGAATVEHVGVGEVFVIAGQSNSTNYGQTKLRPASGMVTTFDGQQWRIADDPQPGAGDRSAGGSCWPAFGDAMAEQFSVPIGIACTGFGGTSVNQWLPAGERYHVKPTAGGNFTTDGDDYVSEGRLYEFALRRMEQLGAHGFRAVLWHQGESDANQPHPTPRRLTGDEYAAALTRIITQSRRDAGWRMPWFTAQVSYNSPLVDGSHTSHTIRDGQAKLWADKTSLQGPDTDTLGANMRQGVHFNQAGQRAHGELWAQKVRPWLDAELARRQGEASDNSAIVPVTQDRDYRIYDWLTRHRRVMDYAKRHPPGVIWIGDSITHYFAGPPEAPIARAPQIWAKHLEPRGAVNLGFGWDRTENVLWRLDHGELDGISPKLAVILIGTNNLDFNTADQIAAGIEAVCDRIHERCPSTKILLLGVLPRQRAHKVQPAEVNKLVSRLGQRDEVTYLNVSDAFIRPDGQVDPALFADEVHPNAAGYAALCAKLEPTLSKLMGD